MNVLKKLFISTNGESSNELSRKQWFHVYLEHVTILIAITLSIYTHHQVSCNSLIAVKFSIESQILTSVVHMLLLDCDEIEYFINGILARRGLKISPQKLENVQSIDYIDMDEAKYSSFSSRKADRSYRLLEKEVWFLTSVIFLSLNHFSRLSSRMAGKQGRMQSLPFKLRFPCTRNVVWPADRSIAMLWPSRMDRNDNDTLGELLVSRPSKKRESLLLADIRIVGRRIVF